MLTKLSKNILTITLYNLSNMYDVIDSSHIVYKCDIIIS